MIPALAATRFAAPVAGHRSLLAVPMLEGAILLSSAEADRFTREHQDMLFTLASQTGLALSNSRSYTELAETQAQLLQSSKMAAVGQLAAGVAHELNSPLAVVRLALEAVEESGVPEKSRRRLERARNAVDRVRNIVERLLSYSRAGDRQGQAVELGPLAADTLDFLRHQLKVDEIELELDLQEAPKVHADPRELQQILINLILNARDASLARPAPRRLRVFTKSGEDGVELGVQDWGEGMAAEDQAKVFDPFYSTRADGTGLGLPISRELAERWDGQVMLESEPGRGTTARLRLPAG